MCFVRGSVRLFMPLLCVLGMLGSLNIMLVSLRKIMCACGVGMFRGLLCSRLVAMFVLCVSCRCCMSCAGQCKAFHAIVMSFVLAWKFVAR